MNTKSSKKITSTVLTAIIVLSMLAISTAPASAATEEEIEQAIVNGLEYLNSTQNRDGSWGTSDKAAVTGLVLLKLQERAWDLGKDPYDNNPASPMYYIYADNVIAGMDYMISKASVVEICMQTHGDPDANGNGQGIVFKDPGHDTYTTGIALCALSVSGQATYEEIAQDTADWLAYAQVDAGTGRGGWTYAACDNCSSGADNSNSGYATLGLAYAEDFGCTVPDWVKNETIEWIKNIQCKTAGTDHGGSGYGSSCSWVNILKTGNLLQQMAFCGYDPTNQSVLDAIDYLERHWQDANQDPGWGYSLDHPECQAMFTTMKGLTSMGIDKIDTNGDGVPDDWFNQEPPADPPEDFASACVIHQNPDGSWSGCKWGDTNLCTAWCLLTLEKIAPQPDPWVEINKELDKLIEEVDAADMPNIIKHRLIDKLVYAKELKDNAKEECEAGNFDIATKKLGVAKNQVESFERMVKITRRISPADKASFLAESAEIIVKIDKLIEHIETEHEC